MLKMASYLYTLIYLNVSLQDHVSYPIYTGVDMYILNTDFFGYIMQTEEYEDINEASQSFFEFKLRTLGKLLVLTMK